MYNARWGARQPPHKAPRRAPRHGGMQPKVDSLARGKSVCPKPKQFVLGGRGALGLIPDASWGGGKATAQRKM